jgi:hypothetical protein
VRPHVLKVDVEGHDYQVLMSFLNDDMPSVALPLLISFEAKSINAENTVLLKAQLAKRGYVVSHMANDGFALLKADAWKRQAKRRPASPWQRSKRQPGSEEEAVAIEPMLKRKGAGRSKEGDDAAQSSVAVSENRRRTGGGRRKHRKNAE